MNMKLVAGLTIIVISLAIFAGSLQFDQYDGISNSGSSEMNTFNSFEEIQEYINAEPTNDDYYGNLFVERKTSSSSGSLKFSNAPTADLAMETDGSSGGSDYSTTNIQVEGVDEGDIVKNDGKYAYIVSRNQTKVYILDVYPPKESRIISEIEINMSISEIYVNNDKLVVLGSPRYNFNNYYWEYDYYYSYSSQILIHVYDITDRSEPVLKRNNELYGNYINSRMIGDHFYIIMTESVGRLETEADLPAPPNKIYYLNNTSDNYYQFTNITSINVQRPREALKNMIILMGSSGHIFVSTKNIYITCRKRTPSRFYYEKGSNDYVDTEYTLIVRISIKDGLIRSEASGAVPGHILNRFSMDEHRNYFRIATTTGRVSRNGEGTAKNHVFVLNMDMITVGQVVDIAPGERIYSARFMGERGYIVTFKKVDPFFVIDLSNPNDPEILGELKIPGYSDYLHPYDENHVIGIGKDTVEANEGEFAWYQGVKLSLFDVTNVNKPKELSKFIIGDRGTDSEALRDPHAFLFNKEKHLLVIPIRLAEIDESQYPYGVPDNAHGEYTWNGAYVFDISTSDGFNLKGTVTHMDDEETIEENYYWGSRYYSNNIKRSFYIDETLYTVSDNLLKANELSDLDEIADVGLVD
jgi:uncharacterized secreted protein with C-terminal beta-propeller domain